MIRLAAVWSVEELVGSVGSVNKAAALKALLTWVDLGVLKEDEEGTFRLLEVAEEPSTGPSRPRIGWFYFVFLFRGGD